MVFRCTDSNFSSFQFLLRQSLLEQKHESPPKAQKKGTRNNLINVSKSVKHKDSLRISKHTHIIKPYSWNKTLKTFGYLDKKEWVNVQTTTYELVTQGPLETNDS